MLEFRLISTCIPGRITRVATCRYICGTNLCHNRNLPNCLLPSTTFVFYFLLAASQFPLPCLSHFPSVLSSSRLSVQHFHRFRISMVSGERPRCLTSAKDSRRYNVCMPSGSRMNSIILLTERAASNLIMACPSQNASDVEIILTCQQEALDLQHLPTHQAR